MAEPLADPSGNEYVRVRDSGLHGKGLFAAIDLPAGTNIIEYRGEKVSRGEGNRRAARQAERGRTFIFRLNQRFDIDGSKPWNVARRANHSCDPNAESQNDRGRRIWLHATRDIAAGDEITYDYHFDFQDPPPECHCRTAKCIGYMVGPQGHRELRSWLKAHGKPVPARLRRLPRDPEPRQPPGRPGRR